MNTDYIRLLRAHIRSLEAAVLTMPTCPRRDEHQRDLDAACVELAQYEEC